MNTPDIPKVTSQDIQSEVQDFSMPSKKQPTLGNSGKGKLDDMLNKLKKKNNCVSNLPNLIVSVKYKYVLSFEILFYSL